MLKEILAIIATVLVTASYIPQIAKGFATKSMRDVSMLFCVIIALGVFVWIVYAIVIADYTFLIANIIIFIFAIILIAMKLYYDKLRKV